MLLIALTALAGCGTIYRSASVTPGLGDGTNVRVVPLSVETVGQANQSSYQPKTLPAVFSLTAKGGTLGRGAGALPQPTVEPESRPGALALRVPPAANPGAYRIGVGDVVLLSTPSAGSKVEGPSGRVDVQNARRGYTVQDDGSINILNIGRVRIAGLTIEDAEAALFQKLVEHQLDPTLSLEISEFNARKVSIGGAVSDPGVVPVSLTPLYLGDALAEVGGVSVEDQHFASVRIYRQGTLYQIPVTTLYERGDLLRTRLVDGDVVFVDTDYALGKAQSYFEQQIALVAARQSAREAALKELQLEVDLRRDQLEEARRNHQSRIDLGADDYDYVYLTGEVGRQSRFPLPYDRRATLADALFAQADGVAAETGDISQIYVMRAPKPPSAFGAVTAWHLDARNAANYVLTTMFELRPDDIIFVAPQPITRWNRTVAQILPSLVGVAKATTD